MNEKMNAIVDALNHKASTKQIMYEKSLALFSDMKVLASKMAKNINQHLSKKANRNVHIKFIDVGKFEFQLKLSGELMVFSLHSNIVRFPAEHILNKNPYVRKDFRNGYFAAIMAYNFLSDSLKYSRMNDLGYLLARLFINHEDHFYIEGVKPLNFLHPDIQENILNEKTLTDFLQSTMCAALDNDSIMPTFEENKTIMVGEKLATRMLGGIKKVGFKMSYESDFH